MNVTACIQHVFPNSHRFFSFFTGFSIGFAIIMPRPHWLPESAWLAVYVTLMVILCLCLYLFRPKERLISLDGWRALGLATSGFLFWALSAFDWFRCMNNPIAIILVGGIALLFRVIHALWHSSDWHR